MLSEASYLPLILLSGAFALHGQVPASDRKSLESQSDTQASSTEKQSAQKPSAPTPKPRKEIAGGKTAQEIANEANNPAAPVTLIQFRDVMLPNVPGAAGVSHAFQMQPVLPVGPFHAFPVVQLVKMTIPFPVLPGPINQAGMGDLQVFDLFSFKQSWGRWGFGPALVFPTASDTALGAGKWQAGPAVGLIYTGIKNLTAGAIVQNPVSYAGSSNRPNVNNMLITPTFTFNLEDGWFVASATTTGHLIGKTVGLRQFPWGPNSAKSCALANSRSVYRLRLEDLLPHLPTRPIPGGSSVLNSARSLTGISVPEKRFVCVERTEHPAPLTKRGKWGAN